jgi:sulfur-carrier protein adenylyltransferase/sulfurtransferase
VLLGAGETLRGRLMLIDALYARVREVRFDRDPRCAVCGEAPAIRDVAAQTYEEPPLESPVAEIDAADLEETLRGARLLDVREPHEAVLGSIDGAIRMPASELEARMHELDTAAAYVVACRVGAKSLWAAGRLRDAGFDRVIHLRGGLLAYAARHSEFEFF